MGKAETIEQGIQRLPSGKYRIRWYDATGNRRTEGYRSFAAAKAGLRRRQVEADDIRAGRVRPRSTQTVGEAFSDWLETRPTNRRRANESHFRNHIEPFMGHLKLAQVTDELVRRFQRKLEQTPTARHNEKNEGEDGKPVRFLSENTRANVLRTLSKFMGDMEYPIRLRLKVAESPYAWLNSPADVARFLDACGDGWFRMTAAIAVYAGLRKGEIAGLLRKAVDLANGTIDVSRSYDGPTKSKRQRHVPIAPELASMLRRWMLSHPGELLVTVDGAPMTRKTEVSKRTRRACKRAKVDSVDFHDLRHTAASHLAKRVPLPLVGAVLGHIDPKTTNRYAHHDTEALAKDPRLHLSYAAPAGELAQLPRGTRTGHSNPAAHTKAL